MIRFSGVRCPRCEQMLMEIATGLARIRCPKCRARVWVGADGARIEILQIDDPLKRVDNSA